MQNFRSEHNIFIEFVHEQQSPFAIRKTFFVSERLQVDIRFIGYYADRLGAVASSCPLGYEIIKIHASAKLYHSFYNYLAINTT